MKISKTLMVATGLFCMSLSPIQAMLEPFPKVTGVSPTTVNPGSLVTLSGANFSYTGVDTGCNTPIVTNGTCPWKTVLHTRFSEPIVTIVEAGLIFA